MLDLDPTTVQHILVQRVLLVLCVHAVPVLYTVPCTVGSYLALRAASELLENGSVLTPQQGSMHETVFKKDNGRL